MLGLFKRGRIRRRPLAIIVELSGYYDLYDAASLVYIGQFQTAQEAETRARKRGYRVEKY